MAAILPLACFVAVMFAALDQGESLKCFKCVSSRMGNCDTLLDLSKLVIQECPNDMNACMLLNTTINGVTEIRRECSTDDECSKPRRKRQAGSFSHSCSTCSWSLCNGANHVGPSFGFGIFALIITIFYF